MVINIKIKGVIEEFKKRKKILIKKKIIVIVKMYLELSLELLRAVWGQFQIVPYSSLYFFSRSIGPFQCLVNANYSVLICCTCHFQCSSLFFVYFGFLCLHVSSVSNFCPDTRGKGGHLFRLTCPVVLWGGRNTANKHHWRVWGVLTVYGPHWFCPSS